MIKHLCDYDPTEKLKTLINQLAFKAGITYGNTETDKILNKVKLDMFFAKKRSRKKRPSKQNYAELIKTHRQFEAIARSVAKGQDLNHAATLVDGLLSELNISTTLKTRKHVRAN